MCLVLTPHPGSRSSSVARIDVAVTRQHGTRLLLSYVVTGDIGKVCLPRPKRAERADDLWKQTCFEAFLGAPPAEPYYEFNFSPSMQWAAYHFSNYRTGMREASEIDAIPIKVSLTPECFTLQAAIDMDVLSALPRTASWRIGLSALIEGINNEKSYWALAHPPGPPDFHRADCFVHEISPTVSP
jgi:hypothetical protein